MLKYESGRLGEKTGLCQEIQAEFQSPESHIASHIAENVSRRPRCGALLFLLMRSETIKKYFFCIHFLFQKEGRKSDILLNLFQKKTNSVTASQAASLLACLSDVPRPGPMLLG